MVWLRFGDFVRLGFCGIWFILGSFVVFLCFDDCLLCWFVWFDWFCDFGVLFILVFLCLLDFVCVLRVSG